MTRRVIAGLVVVGLAIGIWVLWPREEPGPTPTTTVHAVASSTSTKVATRTTGSSIVESHIVTTVEEAEDILRQLWFGWFEGIYNQNEDRIKEVVGSQKMLDSARSAFGNLPFLKSPVFDGVTFQDIKILTASNVCLATWSQSDTTFLENPDGQSRSGVDVLRWDDSRWLLVSSWQYEEDLWESDCESALEPLS